MPVRGVLQLVVDDDDDQQQQPSSTTSKGPQRNNDETTMMILGGGKIVENPKNNSNNNNDERMMVLGGIGGRGGMNLAVVSNSNQQQQNSNANSNSNQQNAPNNNTNSTGNPSQRGVDIPMQTQRLLETNKPFVLPGVVSTLSSKNNNNNNNTNNNNNNANSASSSDPNNVINNQQQTFPYAYKNLATSSSSGNNQNNNNNSSSSKNGGNDNNTTPTTPFSPSGGRFPRSSSGLDRNLSFGGGLSRLAGVPAHNILQTAASPNGRNTADYYNNNNDNNTITSSTSTSPRYMNINTATAEELAALFEEIQYVRAKTSHVAIIASLHDGLDPRTLMASTGGGGGNDGGGGMHGNISQRERAYTARLECWRDPLEFDTASSGGGPNGTMAAGVAQALSDQYRALSQISSSDKFWTFSDPTDNDIERGLLGVRRKADECRPSFDTLSRIVVHYNGHGMITSSEGDLYFPNISNTHFVPMSLSHFSNCVGSPALYVFDCDRAGGFAKFFERNLASDPLHSKDILLCACGAYEELPRNPGYPMDLFTSCLTTPLRTLLLWSAHNNSLLGHISATAGAAGDSDDDEELQNFYNNNSNNNNNNINAENNNNTAAAADSGNNNNNINTDDLVFGRDPNKPNNGGNISNNLNKRPLLERPFIDIPGSTTDRKTPLGELQLILTALIDMIAWSCVSPEKFYHYFRGDTLTRQLVRNFLLADRIMREFGRRPVSYPPIAPEARQHPLWGIWDVVLDGVLCQMPLIQHDMTKYRSSTFFPDQLTAFATWLDVGDVAETNAEQLPCVMFALQKPSFYRDRALLLLGKYFETGKTAVFRGLACGALQYLPLFAKSTGYSPNLLLLNAWHQLLRVLPRIHLNEDEQRLLLSILELTPEACRLMIVRIDGESEEQLSLLRIPTSFSQLQQQQQQLLQQQNDSNNNTTFMMNSRNSTAASSPLMAKNQALPNFSSNSTRNNINNFNNMAPPSLSRGGANNNNNNMNLNIFTNNNSNSTKPRSIKTVLTSSTLSLTKGRTYAAHMLCTLLGYGKMSEEDGRMDDSDYVPSSFPSSSNTASNNNNNNNNSKNNNSKSNTNNNNASKNSTNPSTNFLNIPDMNNEATAHGFWSMRLFSTAYPLLHHEEESMRSWACLLLGCLLAHLPAAREKIACRLFENSSDEYFFSVLQDTSPSVRASCVFLVTKLIGSRLDNLADQDALQRRIFLERLIMSRLFDSFSEVSRLVRREILFGAASVLFHYGSLLPEMLLEAEESMKPEWKAMPSDQFKRIALSLISADSPMRLPPPATGRSTVSSYLTASGESLPITDIENDPLQQSPLTTSEHTKNGPNSAGGNFPPMMMMNNNNNNNMNHNLNNNNNNNLRGGGAPGAYGGNNNHHHHHHHHNTNNNNNNNNNSSNFLPPHPDQNLQNSAETLHMYLNDILLRDLKDVVWDAAVLLARAKASSDPMISQLASKLIARMTNENTCRALPRSTRARAAGLTLLSATTTDASVTNSEAVRRRNRRNEDLARLALFHAEETGAAFANNAKNNNKNNNNASTTSNSSSPAGSAITSTAATNGSAGSQPQTPSTPSTGVGKLFPPTSASGSNPITASASSSRDDQAQYGGSKNQGATAAALAQSSAVDVAVFNSFASCGVSSIRTGAFRLLEPHVFLADNNNRLHVIDYDRPDEPQKLFHISQRTPIHALHLVNDLAPNVSCIIVSASGVVSMYGGFFSSGTTSYGQPIPWQVGPLLSFNSATAFRDNDSGYTQWSGLARRNEYLPSCFRQRDGLFCISPILNKLQCVALQEEKTSQILHLSCESQCSVIATDPLITSATGGTSFNNYYNASSMNQKLYCGFADGTVRLFDQRQGAGASAGSSSGGGSLALMCVVDSSISSANSSGMSSMQLQQQQLQKMSFNCQDPFAVRHISVMNSNENLIMTASCQGGIKIFDLRKRACVAELYNQPNYVVPAPSTAFNQESATKQQQSAAAAAMLMSGNNNNNMTNGGTTPLASTSSSSMNNKSGVMVNSTAAIASSSNILPITTSNNSHVSVATGSLLSASLSQKQDVVCAWRANGGIEVVRLDSTAALNNSITRTTTTNNTNTTTPAFSLMGSASAQQIGVVNPNRLVPVGSGANYSSNAKREANNNNNNSNSGNMTAAIVTHPIKPFFALGSSLVCATNSKQRLKVTTMSM